MLSDNEIKVGYHLIINIYDIEESLIYNNDILMKIFNNIIVMSKLTILNEYHHHFKPYGMTGMYCLSESHLTYHTWPEHNKLCLDVFTCGNNIKIKQINELLLQYFKKFNIVELDR